MKRLFLLLLGVATGTVLLVSAPSRGADCGSCQNFVDQLQVQVTLKNKTADILEKNRVYLAKLSKDDTSKRIKVNSNILITTVQLETIANHISAIQKESETKGCQQCLPIQ